MKPKPEFKKTPFLVNLVKKLTNNGAVFFAVTFLFFSIQLANAEPKPPEFYGIYLVTATDQLIEITSPVNIKTCHFFVPKKENITDGDSIVRATGPGGNLFSALEATEDDEKYVLLTSEPIKIDLPNLKGFIVYGDYNIEKFFIYEYVPSFLYVPTNATFIANFAQEAEKKRQEALSDNCYFDINRGWAITNQVLRRKELAPKCYYIVLRNGPGTLTPDNNVSLLSIGFKNNSSQRWLFSWDDPDREMEIYISRGEICLRSGDYDQGIQYFTKAIKLNPDNVRPYNLRAATYGSKGNYDQAIMDASKAIELDTNYVPAYTIRAMAYAKKGNYDQAAKDTNKVKELDPNNKALAEFLQKKTKKPKSFWSR